jgi:hypothetical protein
MANIEKATDAAEVAQDSDAEEPRPHLHHAIARIAEELTVVNGSLFTHPQVRADLRIIVDSYMAREQVLDLNADRPMDPETEAALNALADTNFEAGEWDRNEDDEPYDAVHERALAAKRAVRRRILATALEYGRITDEILNRITEPEQDADVIERVADYINDVAKDASDVHLRTTKLTQATRLRTIAKQFRPEPAIDVAAVFAKHEGDEPEYLAYDRVGVFEINDGETHHYVARTMHEALKAHIEWSGELTDLDVQEDEEFTIRLLEAKESLTRTDYDADVSDPERQQMPLAFFAVEMGASPHVSKVTATAWAWATLYANQAPIMFMSTVN